MVLRSWRVTGSIRAYFFGALAILAVSGTATSLISVRTQYAELQRATGTRNMALGYQTMMDLSSALGRERAFYVQSLSGGRNSASDEVRAVSDRALAAGRRLLLARGDDDRELVVLDRIGQSLGQLRVAAEATLALLEPVSRAAAALELSNNFDTLKAQTATIAADYEPLAARDATPLQRTLIDLSRLTDSLHTLAGTRATLMMTLVGSQGRPSPQTIEALATLSGRIAGKWERIPIYAASSREIEPAAESLPLDILATIPQLEHAYIQDLQLLYEKLIDTGTKGAPYGLTPAELYARNVSAIRSLIRLGNLTVTHLVASAEASRKLAYWRMLEAVSLPILILTVTGACVLLVLRRVLKPLAALTGTVHELADGRRDLVVPELRRPDEMGKLATAIETLRQSAIRAAEIEDSRQAVEAQLRQAQKMEAMGQLTGGLAHDFNNILGVVIGNIDLLAEDCLTGEGKELAEAALDAAQRGAELTRQLLAFARRQPLAPSRIGLADALGGTTRLLSRTLGEHISLQLKIAADVWPVEIDVAQLESAILNLAVNAKHAMPSGGSLSIEAANVRIGSEDSALDGELAEGDYVCIAVSDTGSGMTPEVLARVFEPFFSTKESGEGSGLGLSMVHGFVKQSGGHTKIYSEPGRGTTVRLYLPRSTAGAASEPQPAAAFRALTGNEAVLVVEDNPAMRDIALRQLKSLGYTTFSGNSAEALAILRGDAAVDLLFTDVMMPGGIDGRELAAAAREIRPELKVLFTSGFTGAAASAALADDFEGSLLSKPYRKQELALRIRAALDVTTRLAV
jgi:signal transduction histidine kinase